MADPVYQGVGGWWYRAPDGSVKSAGPFVTEDLARAAYEKAKPKKPINSLESSEELVAALCALLQVPVPDMDSLESFTVELKGAQPVRVIQTFIAQENNEPRDEKI